MRLERIGGRLLRYALAGILIYLGAFKFTTVEAHAIQPLLAHSPLFGWAYAWLSVQTVSNLIGLTEMVLGGLIAMRRPFPRLAALGSLGAVGVFTMTLSFLFTTPGVWAWVEMFPLPVPSETGGFLLKDVFLFGAAAWGAGEAWGAAEAA